MTNPTTHRAASAALDDLSADDRVARFLSEDEVSALHPLDAESAAALRAAFCALEGGDKEG